VSLRFRAKIDLAGDEIGRSLQKCLQLLSLHMGVKTFRRSDIGMIDGPAGAAPRAPA
jgi:hypothetical protein